jgi:hypothetical protein
MIEFSSPTWDARTSVYKIIIRSNIELTSDPQYVDLSGLSFNVETPDTSSQRMKNIVEKIADALIDKDAQAKWFSSRLKVASVLKRLSHKWLGSDLTPTNEWSVACWSPLFLEVASQGFTIHWRVTKFEKSSPQISSRFLAISRPESPTDAQPVIAEATKQITIHPSSKMASEELEAVTDIPFTNENTAFDFQQQLRDKEALQEARLRLALAKLKTNRLSNTYYQKYGEVYTGEGESSDESDASD